MENDLFHVQWTALSNKCCRNIIALKGKLHQLDQLTDMVKICGSNSKLMVTGSDDPVTQCATLKAWSTLHIILQNKIPGSDSLLKVAFPVYCNVFCILMYNVTQKHA